MLYKGDDSLQPKSIPFLSDACDILVPPLTMVFHDILRLLQKQKRNEIRNMKVQINPYKLDVQTGVMISKIPCNRDSEISYEYYAWLGNKLKILDTKLINSVQFIETSVIIHKVIESAILIETITHEKFWIPKDQIDLSETSRLIQGEEYLVKISRYFYKKQEKYFGIT